MPDFTQPLQWAPPYSHAARTRRVGVEVGPVRGAHGASRPLCSGATANQPPHWKGVAERAGAGDVDSIVSPPATPEGGDGDDPGRAAPGDSGGGSGDATVAGAPGSMTHGMQEVS